MRLLFPCCSLSFSLKVWDSKCTTRADPYTWSYVTPFKWPYKWATGDIIYLQGGDGMPLVLNGLFWDATYLVCDTQQKQTQHCHFKRCSVRTSMKKQLQAKTTRTNTTTTTTTANMCVALILLMGPTHYKKLGSQTCKGKARACRSNWTTAIGRPELLVPLCRLLQENRNLLSQSIVLVAFCYVHISNHQLDSFHIKQYQQYIVPSKYMYTHSTSQGVLRHRCKMMNRFKET